MMRSDGGRERLILTTDIGALTLIADGEVLVGVRFGDEGGSPHDPEPTGRGGSSLLMEAARQIGEYLVQMNRGNNIDESIY